MAPPSPGDSVPAKFEVFAYTGSDLEFELRRVADFDPKGQRTGRIHALTVRSEGGLLELYLTPAALERLTEVVCKSPLD